MTNKDKKDITVYPKDFIPYAIKGTTYGFKIVKGAIGPILTETKRMLVGKPKEYIMKMLKAEILTKVKGIPKAIVDGVVGCTDETPALCASGGRRKTRRERRRKRRRKRRRTRRKRRRKRRKRRRTRKGGKCLGTRRRQRGGGCGACLALALL